MCRLSRVLLRILLGIIVFVGSASGAIVQDRIPFADVRQHDGPTLAITERGASTLTGPISRSSSVVGIVRRVP